MSGIREEFEARYPLPEGMERDGESYAGGQFWWLWKERWDAWQASRAALKVELPDNSARAGSDPYQDGYYACREDVTEALQQAGIEVVR